MVLIISTAQGGTTSLHPVPARQREVPVVGDAMETPSEGQELVERHPTHNFAKERPSRSATPHPESQFLAAPRQSQHSLHFEPKWLRIEIASQDHCKRMGSEANLYSYIILYHMFNII